MTQTDISAAHAVADAVHRDHPEDRAVFAERLRLYPAGCFVLPDETGALAGYALSHPFAKDSAPALNTLLGVLPENPDTYYIHDVSLLPAARGTGAASVLAAMLKAHARARGFDSASLIAVNDAGPFWEKHGFAVREVPAMRGKLAGYGGRAAYMRCVLAP